MRDKRVENVMIDCLQLDLSPRISGCDPNHVSALAEVIEDVPPIVVHASTMRVIDGAHRVQAAKATGQMTIRAIMFEGDEVAAHIEAVYLNVVHGKPLSLAEREAAAAKFLEMVPEWSNRRIAKVSGLSPKTVGGLRGRATVDSDHLAVRVGRDGRSRPVDSSGRRQDVVDAFRSDPGASNRAIAKRTGASPATVRDVKERLARGETGLTSVARLRRASDTRAAPADPPPTPPGRPRRFADWFALRNITEVEWRPFVDTIPISHVYEVADECRRRSETWKAFASALEDRARSNRRSPQSTPAGDSISP